MTSSRSRLGHRLAGALGAVDADARRADGRGVGEGRLALLAHHADVPQLRHDRAARRVHGLGDLRPARQLLLAVEARHPVALSGRLVADVGPLGDDQAHARGGAAGVVRPHVLARDAARREHARHGRHRDAVRDFQTVQRDGRDRISAARETGDAASVTEVLLLGTSRYVHKHGILRVPTAPAPMAFRWSASSSCDPGHGSGVHGWPATPEGCRATSAGGASVPSGRACPGIPAIETLGHVAETEGYSAAHSISLWLRTSSGAPGRIPGRRPQARLEQGELPCAQ